MMGCPRPSHWLRSLLAAAVSCAVVEAAQTTAGRVQQLPLASDFVGPGATVSVLLPAAHAAEPEARFRVLYVLPVESRVENKFGDSLEVIAGLGLHDSHRLICVAPTFDTTPWYGNHATDPRPRQERHVVEALVPFVDEHFRTVAKAEGRLLLGFSKSGWGAVTLLLRNRDTFAAAASWDAPLMLTEKQFGIWGTDGHYGTAAAMAEQLPTTLLRRQAAKFRKEPRLVIAGSNLFGTFTDKRFPYDGPPHTEAFHRLADELGVAHVYDPKIRAGHSWDTAWVGPVVERLVKLPPPEPTP